MNNFLLMLTYKNWVAMLLFLAPFSISIAQSPVFQDTIPFPKKGLNDTIPVAYTVEDGILMPWIGLSEVIIRGRRIFKSAEDRKAYLYLRRSIFKVMPVVERACQMYKKHQRKLALEPSKKERKKRTKIFEKELEGYLKDTLTEFTVLQGKLFTKLIERELGMTTYDLLKQHKGKIRVFFYQAIAKTFKQDLKAEYNYSQERDIESILEEYYKRKKIRYR